jgi:hypothetical protein
MEGMADHPERERARFTPVEMRRLWTYSDGVRTAKGCRLPDGAARAGSWLLVDQATGNVQGVVSPGEFSRRFRPVNLFADVPGLPTYLGTVTASDSTALVGLALDRNPFMLANGPRRRKPRAGPSPRAAPTWPSPRNPRQEVQDAHLHAYTPNAAGPRTTSRRRLRGHPVIGAGYLAFSAALGSDAVKVEPDSTRLAADVGAAARPWGGNYCSHQLGGAIDLVRLSLADTGRLHAAQRATAGQRASFGTFAARRGLSARSLDG